MNAIHFVEFCKGHLHHFDRPIFLIVAGRPVYKAVKVNEFVALTQIPLQLFFLLSCSPHLKLGQVGVAEHRARLHRPQGSSEHDRREGHRPPCAPPPAEAVSHRPGPLRRPPFSFYLRGTTAGAS